MLTYKRLINKKIKGFIPILLIISMIVVALSSNGVHAAVSLNLYQVLGEEKGFFTPIGAAVDASNNVYIADYSAGKIFKLTPPPTITVTAFITVEKPVSVAYYNNKLYVVSATVGGKVYNVSDGSYANISFGTGYGDYRDIKKPADIVVDSGGNIYVADMYDNYIKKYNSSGAFLNTIGGPFPINNASSTFGNGLFYLLTTLAYDSATNRLLAGDTGNTSPYIQIGSTYSYKTKTWTKSSKLYGKPKGKVQVYNISNSTWIRQVLGHGGRPNYGQAYTVSGLWVDSTNNHLYAVDSDNKKIIVIDNVANDSKAPLWTTRTVQDQQQLNANEAAVADAPEQDPINTPSRYTVIQGVYDLSGYFGFFRDVVKAGNYLVVTDRGGKVYYFSVSIN